MSTTTRKSSSAVELSEQIYDWIKAHPNPYDAHTNEKVYWTFNDLLQILEDENISDNTVEICWGIFKRFKFYY